MKVTEWPSREEWAQYYQHPHWDECDCPYDGNYSHRLSSYATLEEVAALTTASKNLYRELGNALRAANLHIKPWRQQRGEGSAAWYRRFRQLPAEDQEAFHAAESLRYERSAINDLLARIRDDQIPNKLVSCGNYAPGKAGELVAPFNARYDAALEAARDTYIREYAARHQADDAAWEKELKRREMIDEGL